MDRKKKIGILGGSFDPPTYGHLQMAAEAINLRHVDEVWMIPCGNRSDKNISTKGEHRLKMTQLMIDSFFERDFPIKVHDIEIQNKELIPTYELMKTLIKDPDNEGRRFYFILGSDLLDSIRSWDYGEKLVREINFIIFIRIGFKVD